MKHPGRFLEVISKGLCWLSLASLSVMIILTSCDVVMRYFGRPIKGTFDIVGLCSVFVIALPIAYTQLAHGHIAIDFIIEKFPKKIRSMFDVTNYVLNFLIYAILAWQSILYGKKLWNLGRVSESVQIPLFPFPFVLALGGGLMCAVLLYQMYILLFKAEKK
jgi:TRAP-type transport system small permease protein